jgi:hypothetical protein
MNIDANTMQEELIYLQISQSKNLLQTFNIIYNTLISQTQGKIHSFITVNYLKVEFELLISKTLFKSYYYELINIFCNLQMLKKQKVIGRRYYIYTVQNIELWNIIHSKINGK